LVEREKLLYEVVAACCITETESMSVLTTLLHSARGERMRAVLHEIARDEVTHSRLGWAHLAHEHGQIDVRFLGSLVPVMLEGTVSDALFAAAAAPELEDPQLLQHGVLPHSTKRTIFVQTLMDVTFPGLETFGVDTGPARRWLDQKRNAIASTRQP
jgi:hypothetical protein